MMEDLAICLFTCIIQGKAGTNVSHKADAPFPCDSLHCVSLSPSQIIMLRKAVFCISRTISPAGSRVHELMHLTEVKHN